MRIRHSAFHWPIVYRRFLSLVIVLIALALLPSVISGQREEPQDAHERQNSDDVTHSMGSSGFARELECCDADAARTA